MDSRMFRSRTAYVISLVLIVLALPFLALLLSATRASADFKDPKALIGKWAYTVLGHGNPSSWFEWKTEAGTMEFNKDNMTVTYAESADNCPSEDYCLPAETYTVSYTATANDDGTITVTGDPGPDQGIIRFALSDDGNMAIIDGTNTDDEGQMFIVAVRIDKTRTYTDADANGDYYMVGYEHDEFGEDSGYFRAASEMASMDGQGTLSVTGKWNGDGTIHTIPVPEEMTYVMKPNGSMVVNGGAIGGISGDGKIAVLSNPGLSELGVPTGGVKDDFMSNIVLKKADRTVPYSTADAAGTWAVTFFGDDAGTSFWSAFGIMTCTAAGDCTVPLKVKHSDSADLIYSTVQLPVTIAGDGSINGFFITENIPHLSGAMGSGGNVMILLATPDDETDTDNRRVGVAVKCTDCGDTMVPTLTITAPLPKQKVLDTFVTVEGTATDLDRGSNGIAQVTVSLNGGEEQTIEGATATGGGLVVWSKTVSLGAGANTIIVKATDLKGASTTKTVAFTCAADLTGPVVKVKKPKATISTTATISGTVSDKGGSGVASVTVDGEVLPGVTAADKASVAWSKTVPLELGSNTFTIIATDSRENSTSVEVEIIRTEDLLPPTLKVTVPKNKLKTSLNTVTVTGTATDAKKGDNGIDHVTVQVGSDEPVTVAGATATGKDIAPISHQVTLSPDLNTITITAYDTQGNASVPKVLNVTYTPTAP